MNKQKALSELKNLSSGTIGTLTGLTNYDDIEIFMRDKYYQIENDIINISNCNHWMDIWRKLNINLYVDDLRDCPKNFILAKDIQQAIYYLDIYNINILSLDHDLGCNNKGDLLPTGYDLVKFICEHSIKVNEIYIHTDNIVGRENMYQTLLGAKKRGFIDIEIFNYPYTENKYTSN